MSNFDEKFGPQPVHITEEIRVLFIQAVVVFLISMSIQPSFLYRPRTSDVSPLLCFMFSVVTVVSTIVVHRSFIKPP